MGNNKIVKTAAAVALGASVLATSVAPGAASAATTYKVQSGKLVNAKTGKVIKGLKVYKSKLYNNGKKVKGYKIYSKKLYKDGSLFSGSYKKVYYVAGVKDKTKPVIKVKAATKSVKYGAKAPTTASLVKSVTDNSKLKITAKATITFGGKKVTKIDTKKPGKYTVTFNATDKAGNKAKAVKVIVTVGKKPAVVTPVDPTPVDPTPVDPKPEVDTTKPVITVGEFAATVEFGAENVVIPTATATDNSGETPAVTSEITFNGEKVEKIDTTKPGKYTVTFTAKDTAGNVETKSVEITVAAEKIAIESVSAINATKEATFTVTLAKEASEADLKGTKLNLKGAEDLTASFVKVEGKVATYKVDKDIIGKASYDGEYTVTSSVLKGSATTTYSAVIAGTFVEGFVFTQDKDDNDVALAGATVTVDGKTTTTDADGYYQIAVNPGVKTVEISKGNEFFAAEAEAEVARNNSTVLNKDLVTIDSAKLYFTGTVLDNVDATAVKDAKVQLQTKNTAGEWVNVAGYSVTTDAAGKFVFANNDAANITNGGSVIKSSKKEDNVLAVGQEYRAVVKKVVSKTNYTSVYKEQVVSFTQSNKKPETTKLVNVEKVAELQSLTVDGSVLATDANAKTEIDSPVEISFLNTDGTQAGELAEFTITPTLATDKKSFKETYDLIDKGEFKESATSVKPRLVSGTYFMVVKNGANATKAYAVEVTEGGKATVKFAFEKGNSQIAKTAAAVHYVESVFLDSDVTKGATTVSELDKDGKTITNTPINVNYAAYQTVAGKDILISTGTADTSSQAQPATIDATKSSSTKAELEVGNINLANLAASVEYKLKPTSDFLTGLSEKTFKPTIDAGTISTDVLGATKVKSITLLDKTATNTPAITSDVTVKSVKLTDSTGKAVVEVKTDKKVSLTSGTFSLTALDTVGTKDVSSKFAQLTPGKYKLAIELDGYKASVSDEVELKDFQNGNFDLKVEKIKQPVVTGFIRYADGNTVAKDESVNGTAYSYEGKVVYNDGTDYKDASGTVVTIDPAKTAPTAIVNKAEASVIAYDKNGDVVAADNFGEDADTTYKLSGLKAGEEYTFVVRGEGFETQAIKKAVTTDEFNTLNFTVVKGANGQFSLQIVDSENNVIKQNNSNDQIAYSALDAYFDNVNADGSIPAALSGIEFDGAYEVTQPTETTGTAARTFKVNNVSAGAYKLVLSSTNDNKDYVLPQTYNLTLKDIGGTSYATSTGAEIIKVPLKSGSTGSLDVALNLTFTGSAIETAANADIDYIQILDANGAIVKTVRQDQNLNTTLISTTNKGYNVVSIKVPNNATYTVKTFLNNGFVSTDTVTVQNNDVPKTINVSKSER